MYINWKRTAIALPLSAAVIIPAAPGIASADSHDGHDDMEMSEEMMTSVATPAGDLRAQLDHYLSEHAYLAVTTMQKGADGADDFEESAAALEANTKDLSSTITSVYGEEAGTQFEEMWSEHIGYFVDYVEATGAEDEEAKQEALDNLGNYQTEFSEFLDSATEGGLEADAAAEGLGMHVDQLIGAFDSYVAGDYEQAYSMSSDAIEHMYGVSEGLSGAIAAQFPEEYDNTTPDTPAVDLRSDLNFLLSEHAALAVTTMQKGAAGAEDFGAAAGILNQNTQELSDTIASVYGEEAGEQFEEMWSEHIGYFVDYVEAAGAEDEEAKQEALDNLGNYQTEFSEFLAGATEGELEAEGLSEGLGMHVDQLVGAFDSYTMGEYDSAYEDTREAYGHMFGVSEGLSGAIVAQYPENFEESSSDEAMPEEMPQTGLGGSEQNVSPWGIAAGSMALILAGIAVTKRRREEA
ncbi:hypothetical protein [Marinococcus halotolerans]|uniref:hypothetical protein n=1 Tax=Marinococcus halotolerans TaxID=301092 RepID=UPI0003B3FF4D|nr:hypothetical protein [Marinococcus halotolerans]